MEQISALQPTRSTAQPCEIHMAHRPEPRVNEEHHVVPQAWQLTIDHSLFDKRTVTLCPTAHRNVHFWIVSMMKMRLDEDPLTYKTALLAQAKSYRLTREQAVAYLALTRWKETGGSLAKLQAAGQMGQS